MATLGLPLLIVCFLSAVVVEVWLLARMHGEDVREWWAKLGAFLLMLAAGWLVVFATVLYLPAFVYRFHDYYVGTGLATGWAAMTSIAGVLAGRSPRTGSDGKGDWRLDWLTAVAPWCSWSACWGGVDVRAGGPVDTPPVNVAVSGTAHPHEYRYWPGWRTARSGSCSGLWS